MLPTTYAYTRHLLDATSRGGLAVALAALLPCQWSYEIAFWQMAYTRGESDRV